MILCTCLLANHVSASNFTCSTNSKWWMNHNFFQIWNTSWMRLMLMVTVAKTSAMQQWQIWCSLCHKSWFSVGFRSNVKSEQIIYSPQKIEIAGNNRDNALNTKYGNNWTLKWTNAVDWMTKKNPIDPGGRIFIQWNSNIIQYLVYFKQDF